MGQSTSEIFVKLMLELANRYAISEWKKFEPQPPAYLAIEDSLYDDFFGFDPFKMNDKGEFAKFVFTSAQVQGTTLKASTKVAMTIEGLSITEAEIDAGLQIGTPNEGDTGFSYPFMVSLLDGDVRIIGSKFDDAGIEVGEGGTATIKSKAGDDHIYVWHQKAIVFNGGGGSDTIEFAHQIGGFDGAPIGAVIDLTAGTGTNPFGGAIKLKKVENVVGEFDSSNSLRGDKHDNRLNGGIAADTLRGEGGDDTIVVKYHTTLNPRATIADGGKGTDTLYAELSDASAAPYVQTGPFTYLYINILDLENPGLNTGTFHGGTFTNFEIFEASSQGEQRFDFRGSDAKETVLGGGSTDLINGRAGNDILDGAYGNDSLTGGLGKDVFAFHLRAARATSTR